MAPQGCTGRCWPGGARFKHRLVREALGRKHARGGGRGDGGSGGVPPSVARSAQECPGCYGDGTCAAREREGGERGERTCAGRSLDQRERAGTNELACEAPAPSIFDIVKMCTRPPFRCTLFVSNPPSHRMFCRRMGWPSSPKCRPPRAAPAKVEARARKPDGWAPPRLSPWLAPRT